MGFRIGSFVLAGDVVIGAYRSDVQLQLTVIPRLYDEITPDVAVALQVSVGWPTGRTHLLASSITGRLAEYVRRLTANIHS